jgi:hypothetical protein
MKNNIHLLSYLAHYFLEWEMFPTKFLAATKTHILYSVILFFESRAVYDIMCKNIVELDISLWQYGACTLHAGYLRLQTHTQWKSNVTRVSKIASALHLVFAREMLKIRFLNSNISVGNVTLCRT